MTPIELGLMFIVVLAGGTLTGLLWGESLIEKHTAIEELKEQSETMSKLCWNVFGSSFHRIKVRKVA